MSPRDLRSILDSWACWVQDGRPIPFNCWPPASILARWNEERSPVYGSRPLWKGRMKSFWLSDADRLLQTLPERRLCILLAVSLPGRGTDAARAAELGVTLETVRYARKMAREALQGL